jgi:signal transduction histidine kinase
MQADVVRVLLVEDDEDDYVLTRDLLEEVKGQRFALEWADGFQAGLQAARRREHDVCLIDYRLGGATGLDLLRQLIAEGCPAPLILLTGQADRDVDLEAMRAGAADYLTKGSIDSALLERSIRYAIERKRDRDALRNLHADLERQVQQRTEALRQADRRKDEFLAMLAHELRNPLAPVRNAIHTLLLAGGKPEIARQAQEIIERQVGQMARLIDDLLDVSRISRGKIELRKERVRLSSVIHLAVETSKPLIEASGHDFRVVLPEEELHLEADPTRLAQVLSNLLNNSARYTERGGRISLAACREGDRAALRVSDTGVGIPREMLPHIFEMFRQVDRSLERAQGGLGIGLTLVRRLVELHGGSVEAHSEGPGKGSDFVVHLPLAPSPAGATGNGDPSAAPGQSLRRRVLLVDDNRDAADSLAMLLRLLGHEVHVAFDGAAALQEASARRPEVVLLDIGLPKLNGYEVAARLRAEPALRCVCLVALTGWGQEGDRQRALESGFDHHMLKPVDLAVLEKLLGSLGKPAGTASLAHP